MLHCSVDGLHSSDLTAYLVLEPNSTMATLAKGGVVYPNAYLPGPSDSFPGILALTTGNNATVTGVYYGKHYTRLWLPIRTCALSSSVKWRFLLCAHQARDLRRMLFSSMFSSCHSKAVAAWQHEGCHMHAHSHDIHLCLTDNRDKSNCGGCGLPCLRNQP